MSPAADERARDEQELGRSLRAMRQRRGMSQADLARYLGTTQQTVGRWETGQVPQPRWRVRIDEFLSDGPEGEVLTFPSMGAASRDAADLNELQAVVVRGVAERMAHGQLSDREAVLVEVLMELVGLKSARAPTR